MARKKYVQLVANTEQKVTLAGRAPVRVICLGTSDVYFRMDGTDAVIRADENFVCPAGGIAEERGTDNDGTIIVSLISAGTPDVGVQLFDRIQGGS